MNTIFQELNQEQELGSAARIQLLRDKMLSEPRRMSLEQARLITAAYAENEGRPVPVKRAEALKKALCELEIKIEPEELIVGNRTRDVRGGVVFPESGISWVDKEIETLPVRPQDRFEVREEDIGEFRNEIYPFWKGRTLEDAVRAEIGEETDAIAKVAKINQKDHAQGHICPDTEKWLRLGPRGIMEDAARRLAACPEDQEDQEDQKIFFGSVVTVLEGACRFIRRYAELAGQMAESDADRRGDLLEVARVCDKLSEQPPETFHEAVQSVWFLFVILHMESNASSFSPGRIDQYLYPYYRKDIDSGALENARALEILECLWLKFNQIVYLRNSHSAKYFAGFPIGFNVAVGGQLEDGSDAANELSYLCLKAQEHLGLPQPNLSARLHRDSPHAFIKECVKVIARGSGMPQCFNDEAVIPALVNQGIDEKDARNYAIVGCVELTTHGNNLGWSDAAMFNLLKALELTLNDGVCLLTGQPLGLPLGDLTAYKTYGELEAAFAGQVDHFIGRMIKCCEAVEAIHQRLLPSPFLSAVIDDCMERGLDVTRGGAHYNLSGIQVIQGANIADSFAAIKKLCYDENRVDRARLLRAMRNNFEGDEPLRLTLLNHAPKYGNDVEWVDEIGHKWIRYFNTQLKQFKNYRGGPYHTGLYTVSAHVPMGQNVGATPDGRLSREPLADGGMSPVYGRDINGPTAVLKSVARIDSMLGSNGTLLNMKFLPEFFDTDDGVEKFVQLLRTFVRLKISHIQFNVLRREDLLAAKREPEKYCSLTVRVAGYTAYFVELSGDLQDEIIARTSYGDI